MSATTVSRSGVSESPHGWSDARSIAGRLALPAILLLAAANFFWQLGSSSYFIDEAFSVMHSLPGFHTLFHQVAHTETTPYTYFLFLHEWMIRTGSQAEWVTRLPSAVAGVVLVGAVYWMARAFGSRSVALGAAALCAISPLIQSYAQETRVYIFLILALVISVGATVRAGQRPERRTALLTVGAVSAFLSVWLHYTAISVLLPLAVWVGTRHQLSRRARVAFIAACLLGVGTVMPLLLEQYSIFPNGGAIDGQINWNHAISVIGTPFGYRLGTPIDGETVGGALVVLFAIAALLLWRRRPIAERGLLVSLGVVGIVGIFILDFTGKNIMITRYTVITAPFLATAIAAACAQLPRIGGVALAAGAVAVSAAGLVNNHSRSGFWPPVKEPMEYVAAHERPGDYMLDPGVPIIDTPIFYYVTHTRLIRPKLQLVGLDNPPRLEEVFRRYKRIWIIDKPPKATPAAALGSVSRLLRRYHFRAISIRAYSTTLDLGLLLTVPDKSGT
jgi:4-amino-4-deoxy-L-arabinose transferase-like glycosyltransferase